jgi:hypothetical protein
MTEGVSEKASHQSLGRFRGVLGDGQLQMFITTPIAVGKVNRGAVNRWRQSHAAESCLFDGGKQNTGERRKRPEEHFSAGEKKEAPSGHLTFQGCHQFSMFGGELVDFLFRFLLALAILFLDFADQAIPFTADAIHVVIGQFTPALFDIPLELVPFTHQLLAIHGLPPLSGFISTF